LCVSLSRCVLNLNNIAFRLARSIRQSIRLFSVFLVASALACVLGCSPKSEPTQTTRGVAKTQTQPSISNLINEGRLDELMDVFDSILQQDPDRHDIRRRLYDVSLGTEDVARARPHGQYLIHQRQFDWLLLASIDDSDSQHCDAVPLIDMARRNPKDIRPLICQARTDFDQGKTDSAIETLQSILKRFPNESPTIALCGRAFIAANRDEDFRALISSASASTLEYPTYWISLGDWARKHHQDREAARAYWEATIRNPHCREAWVKLSTTLKQLDDKDHQLNSATLQAIERRVVLVSRLSELKSSMIRSGQPNRAAAIKIAKTLLELGRLWEAEAWASIALTIPPLPIPKDESDSLNSLRQSIIQLLRKDTPWQIVANRPELQIDLTYLPLPQLDRLNSAHPLSQEGSNDAKLNLTPSIRIAMENEAESRNLNFFGTTGKHLEQPGVMFYQTVGCGGGAIDFDRDGWPDLYLAAAGGTPPHKDSEPNALFRNLGGTFSRVTESPDTEDRSFTQGIAVGDVNEDGFPDLFVLNYGPNTLLINNGDGTFSDRSHLLRENDESSEWSTSGAIADLNGDALADLLVINYCLGTAAVTERCLKPDAETGELLDRACSPVTFPGAADRVLRGSETGNFIDKTQLWEMIPTDVGRGLGVTVGMFDNRRGLDFFVANDMSSNHFWSGLGPEESDSTASFKLQESAILRGLGSSDRAPATGSMGIATGDMDRDGDVDFYVTNFENESNTFHDHFGDGMWRDQTSKLGLEECTLPMVGFGAQAVDLDNDGNLELVVSNGHVDDYPGEKSSPYAQPMQVFRRTRDNRYESVGNAIGGSYLATPHIGRALWTLDADQNGLMDLVVTHQSEPVSLLMVTAQSPGNQSPGNWIKLYFSGRECSRDAIGTRVTIQSGGQSYTSVLTSGDGYLCSNERLISIGLGLQSSPCDVTVQWPDGSSQTFMNLKTNRSWMIVQNEEAFSFTQ
jgi:tetratricopeptide (TPR) repeat protein